MMAVVVVNNGTHSKIFSGYTPNKNIRTLATKTTAASVKQDVKRANDDDDDDDDFVNGLEFITHVRFA